MALCLSPIASIRPTIDAKNQIINPPTTPLPLHYMHTQFSPTPDALERAAAEAETQHREALRASDVRANNERRLLESRLRRAEQAEAREREEGARLRCVGWFCGCVAGWGLGWVVLVRGDR